MDQHEITDDVMHLLQQGMLTEGRMCQLERVAGSGNQLALLEEDGSGAIITVRGPATEAMKGGGVRSFASASREGTWADPDIPDDGMISDPDVIEEERQRAREEWKNE